MQQTGGIGLSRTTGTGQIPVFQGTNKDIQLAQGGFMLDKTNLTSGMVLTAGTPMVFSEATRLAAPINVGIAQATAGASATDYLVKKGHTLKVGMNLASGATGGKAYPITAITVGTGLFDTITVGTTIGAVTAGDTLYASTATGATASALPAANGLLYQETIVSLSYKDSVSVVIRGTVYARRVPYSTAIAALPGLDDIIYSQSH